MQREKLTDETPEVTALGAMPEPAQQEPVGSGNRSAIIE